jgi:hypothetical protein
MRHHRRTNPLPANSAATYTRARGVCNAISVNGGSTWTGGVSSPYTGGDD